MRNKIWLWLCLFSFEATAAIYSLDLPVIWQNKPVGSVTFVLENFDLQAANTTSLSAALEDLINNEVKARLTHYPSADIEIENLALMGINLELNAQDLNVVMELLPEALSVDDLTYGDRNYLAKPTPSASWAMLNNFSLRYDRTSDGDNEYSVDWLADLNIGGHDGLNGEFSVFFDKSALRTETYRGDIRFYYDRHTVPARYEFGDVNAFSRGHLNSANLGGIGYSRSYRDLQPLTKITPSNSQEFYLKQSAEVKVIVNNNIIAKVRLAPGRYDLNDLPLTTGENNVQVSATYVNGEQENFSFSTFYNSQLLEAGRSDFTFNVGYPSTFTNFEYDYDSHLLATGFYEYGITDNFTGGLNGLYYEGQYLLGATAVFGSAYGNLSMRATQSELDAEQGYSLSIDSEHSIWGGSRYGIPNLRLSYEKRDNFSATPWLQNSFFNSDESMAINYTYFFSDSLDLNITGRKTRTSQSSSSRNGTVQLNWRKQGWRVSAEYRYQSQAGNVDLDEHNVYVNVSWTLFRPASRSRTRLDFLGRSDTFRANYTKVNRNFLHDYGYAVDFQRSPDIKTTTLSGSYTGNYFRADMTSRYQDRDALSSSDDHRVNVSTSVGIADGNIGIGQNVRAPFVIVNTHRTLAEKEVQINPTPQGDYLANAGSQIGGLVSLGTPFTDSGLAVDVQNAPLGYDWGPGAYNMVGGTATGHNVLIGSDLSYTIIGYLNDQENNPMALKRGEMRNDDYKASFFTNRKGRFVVEGIGTGDYTLTIGEKTVQVTVVESDKSLIRLGIIKLP
ncbi:MAG: fimbria/pilus outer membrane usher protein [Aestuariibacter sp.]